MLVPAAGAGVPGAPADWDPPDGTEAHLPVLFLDLNADDLSTGEDLFMILFVNGKDLPGAILGTMNGNEVLYREKKEQPFAIH